VPRSRTLAAVTPDLPDPRNEKILVHVGGELVPRGEAKVSVFDSSVQGGDAVWEGLRVYDGKVFRLEQHLDRLEASAKAMAFAQIPSRDDVKRALFDTLKANGMRDGAHVRLTLTRGVKVTSGMSPRWNRSGPCLIVLAEWKAPVYGSGEGLAGGSRAGSGGLKLVTSSVRRNAPQCIDSKIHHNNLINNILAKVEADAAGADDAIMLDVEGYVAETNATNLFLVKKGVLRTPTADHCLPGITRAVVLEIARDEKIPHEVRRVSLSEFHSADEVFTTGTMGELAWVREIDGRTIGGPGGGDGKRGPLTKRLCELFADRTRTEGERVPS
jgi:branched-chain amino acid aminotransferase group I